MFEDKYTKIIEPIYGAKRDSDEGTIPELDNELLN